MKLVIVGLGIQGKKRRVIAGSDVVATVDPIEPTANYKKIVDVPLEDFDAACVCTPDGIKIEVLEYLLGCGKHVLVEKPLLASNNDILLRLGTTAKRTGAVCYTAYNHRFEPHLVRLKDILANKVIGEVYLVQGFYGNGTARDVRNSSWRDQGLGVLGDLGSHLLDISLFCFGCPDVLPEVWNCKRFENSAFDHVTFGFSGKPVFEFQAMLLSWRNSFRFDVYGEYGSAHVDCLCKWGPSTLTIRKRIYPSGKPDEEIFSLSQRDPTWLAEYRHFQKLCSTGGTNLENDLWINETLNHISGVLASPERKHMNGSESSQSVTSGSLT